MYNKTVAIAAKAPTTPPMMAGTFLVVLVVEEAVAPTGAVAVATELLAIVVVAREADDEDDAADETCIELVVAIGGEPSLVDEVVAVENTELVLDVEAVSDLTGMLV